MSIQLPKTVKNIIKHQQIKEHCKPNNIFHGCGFNQSFFDNFKTSYDIVGDSCFKQRFWSQRKQKLNKTIQIQQPKQQQQTNLNTTYCQQSRRIQDGTLIHRLSKEKQLQITRHNRTFAQFESNKKRQEKINNHLKKRLSYFGTKQVKNTITFYQKQIQQHPNPQLIDLINDNIPEYWKNSLRDNQKRLKRHIKGNTFKKQIAQQMLQTLKGRKRLIDSIPHLKQQFLSPICSKKHQKKLGSQGFSIKGYSPSKKYGQTISSVNYKTVQQIPQINFEEIHKIHYNSANKWRVSQFCQLIK